MLTHCSLLLIVLFLSFTAERRAQLSRSRSRTNLFQLENSVAREITFDDTTLTEPSSKPSSQNRRKNSKQEAEDESEAEKLLARLKAL